MNEKRVALIAPAAGAQQTSATMLNLYARFKKETPVDFLGELSTDAVKACIQNFIEKMCDRYFRPLLITQGYHHGTIEYIMDFCKMLQLTAEMAVAIYRGKQLQLFLDMWLDAAIERISETCNIREALGITGIKVTVSGIITDVMADFLMAQSSRLTPNQTLAHNGIEGLAAELGKKIAEKLIQRLPKIKDEDRSVHPVAMRSMV